MLLPRSDRDFPRFPADSDLPEAMPTSPGQDYFLFTGSVGRDGANARPDVIRAQTLLGRAGYIDMTRTEGPTGWYGRPLELAIRNFQKDRGLAADGVMLPGGETLAALQADHRPALAGRPVPSPQQVDDHHERRARGEAGLPEVWPGAAGEGNPASNAGVQLAAAAGEAAVDVPARAAANRLAIPTIPGGWRGQLILKAGKLLSDFPADAHQAYHDKFTREALAEGIASVFGEPLERRESANTKKSANIMMKKCEEVLKQHIQPLGFEFEHKAGGSIKGDGEQEVPETAIKNMEIGRGGGGHNFPDLLYIDKANNLVVGFNIATEKGPGEYITREVGSFTNLVRNMGEWVAKITGKKRENESDEEYGLRAYNTCLEGFTEAIKGKVAKAEAEKQQPQPGPGDTPASP